MVSPILAGTPLGAVLSVVDMLRMVDLGASPAARGRRRGAKLPAPPPLAIDDTLTWVDENGRRLSDRVWMARATVRDAIEKRVRLAVARGDSPELLARDLERHLTARYRPKRDGKGKLLPNQRPGAITSAGRGQGSYAARRLARTEITRAAAIGQRVAAERSPAVTAERWKTASKHAGSHVCGRVAALGWRPVGELPLPPAHPFCLCRIELRRSGARVARLAADVDAMEGE
jgi:hypothetical protein